MASLLKKKIKGRLYYYYVESKRIGGKTKLVKQIYLGSAEKILQKCQQRPHVTEATHHNFGEVASLYRLARDLRLAELINANISFEKERLNVGAYLVLAAINRCCCPKSKRQIGAWYQKTVLPELFGLPKSRLTSQLFWEAMDALDETAIVRIEEQLWKRLMELYHLPLDVLLYDTSNFFSYICDANAGQLPRRGKNKAGKDQLNQVGLALAVTEEFGLPLLHKVYAGNLHDASLFPTVIVELINRYLKLTRTVGEVTFIFDKGNNSESNVQGLDIQKEVHFVGTLVPSRFPHLLRVRLSRYEDIELSGGRVVLAFTTTQKVFGQLRKVVVTYNEKTSRRQIRRLEKHLQAACAELLARRWNQIKDRGGRVEQILAAHRVKDLIQTYFKGGQIRITYDHQAIRQRKQHYGKTILFTDHLDWSARKILEAYRGLHEVEDAFRQMNDPHCVSFRPVYHWTDSKIRVHAFCCVLALLLVRCLQMQAIQAGLKMSIPVLMEELTDIKALIFIDEQERMQHLLSRRSAVQQKLFDLFELSDVARELGIQLN
jgi:transposase